MPELNIDDLVDMIDKYGYPTKVEILGGQKSEFHQAVLKKKGGKEAYSLAVKAGDMDLRSLAIEEMFSDRFPVEWMGIHALSLNFNDVVLQEKVEIGILDYEPWRAYQLAHHHQVPDFKEKAKAKVLKAYGTDALRMIKESKDVGFIKDFINVFRYTDKELCYRVAISLKGDDFDKELSLGIARSLAKEDPEKALIVMDHWYEKDLIIETALGIVEQNPSLVYHIGAQKQYEELKLAARSHLLAENDPEHLYSCGREGSDKVMLWQAQGRLERCYDEWNLAFILEDKDHPEQAEAMRVPGYGMIETNPDRAWWVAVHLKDDGLKEAIRESQLRYPESALEFGKQRKDDILVERAQNKLNDAKGLDQHLMEQLYSE